MSGKGADRELAMLRTEFPGHLIGEESIMGRIRYVARRREKVRTRTPSSHRTLVSCGRR